MLLQSDFKNARGNKGSKPLLHLCYLTSFDFLFSIRLLALPGKKNEVTLPCFILKKSIWVFGAYR